MNGRIYQLLIVIVLALSLSLVSTASAAVTAEQAGIKVPNVSSTERTSLALFANPKHARAQFVLLKTSRGVRLVTLSAHFDDDTMQLTRHIAMDLVITEQGSEILSLDEEALAGLAAGLADIDPVAYLQSTVALKRLTSMVTARLDDPDATPDAIFVDDADPELARSLQNAMDASLKTKTENNALSLVAPSSTHKNTVLTFGMDDDGYHFQIRVVGDAPGAYPASAMGITINGREVGAMLDEDALSGLGLKTLDVGPGPVVVINESGGDEMGLDAAGLEPAPSETGADENGSLAVAAAAAEIMDCGFQTIGGQLKFVCVRVTGNQVTFWNYSPNLTPQGVVYTSCGHQAMIMPTP